MVNGSWVFHIGIGRECAVGTGTAQRREARMEMMNMMPAFRLGPREKEGKGKNSESTGQIIKRTPHGEKLPVLVSGCSIVS